MGNQLTSEMEKDAAIVALVLKNNALEKALAFKEARMNELNQEILAADATIRNLKEEKSLFNKEEVAEYVQRMFEKGEIPLPVNFTGRGLLFL